jgi:hypothetical protein
MALALSVFIGLCSLAVMARDNGLLVSTLAITALVAPGLVLTWAAISARCLRNPIEARRYLPRAGTVEIRFRNPEYASLFLAASAATM